MIEEKLAFKTSELKSNAAVPSVLVYESQKQLYLLLISSDNSDKIKSSTLKIQS